MRKTTLMAALLAVGGAQQALAQSGQSDELEALFSEGMDALKEDRLRSAMESFQTILSSEPSLHRARLELAVAYYRALNYERARELAQRVLDDPTTPPEVRVTVLAFIGQIGADEELMREAHSWRGNVSFGGMYDNNVNVGPSSDLLEIGGLEFRISTTELQDNAFVFNGGVSHKYNPNKRFDTAERTGMILWQSQLGLYHREYQSEEEFDLSVLTASTGPAWIVLRHWRAALNLRADYLQLGDSPLALFTSINPLVTWQYKDGEFSLDGSVADRDYEDAEDRGREGTYSAAGAALARYYNNRKVVLQGGIRYSEFRAEDDQFGNSGPEYFLGAEVNAWKNGRLFARASQKELNYDGIADGFTEARDERERRVVAGFSHTFSAGRLDKWSLSGNVIWTDNDSNIPIFDYDRSQLSMNLGRSF